jgi:hypothetical protein
LADYATTHIGESLPTAEYIGQFFFNPLDKNIYLWDGNVWQPVGVSLGELIFAGTYNASTNRVASITTMGSAIGLAVGQPLPNAASTFTSYYVVVSIAGTGTAPAPPEPLSPPDIILCDGSAWTQIDVSSTYTSQTAANVGFTPAGTIASTNVQGAIEEVATDAANATNLTSGTVAVARGGTGTSSYTKGDLLAASGATALSKLGVGTNGQVLRANSATATGLEWGTDYVGTVTSVSGSGAISVATGTTTPAISVASASTSVAGVVQLSDSTSTTSSSLAATSTAVKAAYDLAAAAMPMSGGTFTADIILGTNVGVQFEGTTDDAYETRLIAVDPTADRTIYLPNADGTLVISGAIANADIAAGAAIVDTKLATISTAGKVSNSATTATSANTASAIVARDASGNFTAGTITASLTGAASLNVLKAGDTMTGALVLSGDPTLSTHAATKNYVDTADALKAPLASPTFTGTVTIPAGASISGYLTTATAASTYAPQASPTFTGAIYANGSYRGAITAVSALDIDLSTANYFSKTINANSTFTVSNVPASRSYSFTLELTHTSGTITWFSGVIWPSGTAPILATGKVHLFMFHTDDGGTTWRASSLINYAS